MGGNWGTRPMIFRIPHARGLFLKKEKVQAILSWQSMVTVIESVTYLGQLIRGKKLTFFLTILNVIPHDIDHIVTVRSVVFMEVADCVTELVENKPNILTAISHVEDLFSSNGAHH